MVLADTSIKRPVMMTMVIFAFVVLGLFSLSRIGVDLFPKIDFPFVSVVTVYPGAGPEEVETLINEKIEEEVAAISGVRTVYSTAQEGVSIVAIELQLGEDVDLGAIDVKDKVDAIRSELPDDIEDPVVQKFEMGASGIVEMSVTGPYDLDRLFQFVDRTLREELSRISGVATVEIVGEKEREIEIALSTYRMRMFGISPSHVVGAIAADNLNLPAGRMERNRNEITLRMNAEFASVEELNKVRVQTAVGAVQLDRIAQITDTFKEQREMARYNGERSINVTVVKQSDANTVQVADDIKVALERIRPRIPTGMEISIARDSSEFIRNSLADVSSNLVLGILFTAIVLFLFLHNWGGTVIAAVAMPISIVSTFLLLDFAGFTLNVMSLMGLAISVGILVVNAIVVLENIERYKQKGMPDAEAASKGTGEIAIAVAAATLTNIVVFTPMAFMQGIIGPIFREFGLTVAFATLFSLLISFTLTPMMASKPLKPVVYAAVGLVTLWAVWNFLGVVPMLGVLGVVLVVLLLQKAGLVKRFANFWDRWYGELANDYQTLLRFALKRKWVIVVSVLALFIASLQLFRFIGSEFFPQYDERYMMITAELPPGSRIEQTNEVLYRVEQELEAYDEVKTIYTVLGKSGAQEFGSSQGVQYGYVLVQLKDPELGDYPPTSEVVKDLRPKLADIPAAQLTVSETTQMGGGGGGADIQIEIQGDDMDEIVTASEKAVEIIRENENALDVRTDYETGKPEIVVHPDRTRLADRGGSVAQVAMMLRNFFEGNIASQYREAGEEYDIRVRLIEEERNDIAAVGDMLIPLGTGFVPLKEVAEIEYASGPTQITRKNKRKMITVSANLAGGTVGELQSQLEQQLQLPEISAAQQFQDILRGRSSVGPRPSSVLPGDVTVYFGGQAEMMAESFSSLLQALVLSIVLTYMLLAAILESYRFPFIIMMTLPLALIGVAAGLVMTGKSISIFSLMAIVMLVGIVVNNGILLIDYSQQLRNEGRTLNDAILEACPVRLRPILMSTAATVLGMFPLALGIGAGGEFRAPMAIVAIGGLVSSTALTLIVIPVLFAMLEARNEREKQEASAQNA
ncbi:MMPL family transporter [bacterium]|nr:MMPL family transporter [bacterium]